MATKNISITEDAYRRLAALRKGNESFSEIIMTITKKGKLSDFYGILSKKEGVELEKNVKELREIHRKSRMTRLKRIVEELNR